MDRREYYRPPDFKGPPPGSFQRQFEPSPRGFEPGVSGHQQQFEEAPGSCGDQSAWGAHGADECYDGEEYYGDYGQQWPQAGGYKRRKKRRFFHKKRKRYAFKCESCDKGFEDVESFDEHMSQHVECPHPQCTFLGSDKLVTMHWKFTHAEESKRFQLKTSEDIEKWREERRKKFPRRDNIQEKNIEAKEETENKEPTPSSEPCDVKESPQKSTEKGEKST